MPQPSRTDAAERPALRLSFSQLTAASLATVSGAVAASFLGIYGTVIGTGLMSLISTAGGVVYQHYLDRTRDRLRKTRVVPRTGGPLPARHDGGRPDTTGAGDGGDDPRSDAADGAEGSSEGSSEDSAMKTRAAPAADTAGPGRGAGAGRSGVPAAAWAGLRRRWRAVAGTAGAAVLVFGIAMGVISTMEAVAGKPTAMILTGRDGSGTTLGAAVDPSRPDGDRAGSGDTSNGTPGSDNAERSPPAGRTSEPTGSPPSRPADEAPQPGEAPPDTDGTEEDSGTNEPGAPSTP